MVCQADMAASGRNPMRRFETIFATSRNIGGFFSVDRVSGGLFENHVLGLVRLDEVPVVVDAQTGTIGNGYATARRLIGIAAGVDRGNDIGHAGPHQCHLIHVGVPDRGHAEPVRGATGVDLEVEAKSLTEMRDLHDAGDAHIVLGIRVDHVAAAVDHE